MPAKDFNPEKPSTPATSIIAGLAVLLGVASFSFGSWLAWHPAGFIMGGLSIAALGILLGRKVPPVRRRA